MKKNILLLTDFSENATSAAEAGLALSRKLHTDLLLYHSYITYSALPFAAAGALDPEAFPTKKHQAEQKLKCLMEGLESLAMQPDTATHLPVIRFQAEDSDLGTAIETILDRENVELIVMGARSAHPDDPLAGADTIAVIRHSDRPVLSVTAGTNLTDIHEIIFATDFDSKDLDVIRYLVKLCALFGYTLEIVHVNLHHKQANNTEEDNFRKSLDELQATGLKYTKIAGKDLTVRLNKIAQEHGPAILAVRHRHYPFLVDLFVSSKSKALLARQKCPLLIFPEQIK